MTTEDRLRTLAYNLWWTWHPEVLDIFRTLDPATWRDHHHNPVAVLAALDGGRLITRIEEEGLASRIAFHYRRLEEYLTDEDTWCADQSGALRVAPIAYFSAEFGLHESLPLYSGGLGILAGDHLKSASDLGVPAIGVGLFYAAGYFRQRLDASGWQQESYGTTDLSMLPLVRAATPDGGALTVTVRAGADDLCAGVWMAHVGRSRLLLLDTDIADNPAPLRGLTAQLYGGDEGTRIRQEILLGVGGLRALAALGIVPRALHLNEGHSAFAVLEQTRARMVAQGLGFDDAWRQTTIQTVFTTHTPVDAGHDRFAPALMDQELGWLREALGLPPRRFLGLGRVREDDEGERFCMTVLALKGARQRNGVSTLHGHVSRRAWRPLWPGRPEEEVPIGHVTNGVHVPSWLAPSMKQLYDRHLGPDWVARQTEPSTWHPIERVDDGELWEVHTDLRRTLVDFVRRRTGAAVLDPDAFTIGFARRFATYKRATLLLADRERFVRLCTRADRPVQVVFAGKAHPRDDGGKRLIQDIVALARDSTLRGRVVFVEDYDMHVGRHLVQGVDLWLNTPERPLEACGTSGQKAILNGVLTCSVLDGWWAEAYDGENGFAIGSGEAHADSGVQWQRDAQALADTLEHEVVPLFYQRDATGIPRAWTARMKRAILTLGWMYNADRMVMDYARGAYLPAVGATHRAV